MKWTNTHKLPDRVIDVLRGKYIARKPEANRLSVTDLICDPLPRALYINHWDDIVSDYSDLFTMVQGIALHSRYEKMARPEDDAEHKYEDIVDKFILVGKADIAPKNAVIEVKQTGVYGPKYRMDKWTAQMNIYAWQRRMRKTEISELLVDVWYRDWKQNNTFWKDYPCIPYECITLPLWSFEMQQKYIDDQVALHAACEVHDSLSDYDKPCSDAQRGIRYEAYKNKNKTTCKIGSTFEEVNNWCIKMPSKDTYRVVKSSPVFCERYCRARSVCPFAKEK